MYACMYVCTTTYVCALYRYRLLRSEINLPNITALFRTKTLQKLNSTQKMCQYQMADQLFLEMYAQEFIYHVSSSQVHISEVSKHTVFFCRIPMNASPSSSFESSILYTGRSRVFPD